MWGAAHSCANDGRQPRLTSWFSWCMVVAVTSSQVLWRMGQTISGGRGCGSESMVRFAVLFVQGLTVGPAGKERGQGKPVDLSEQVASLIV